MSDGIATQKETMKGLIKALDAADELTDEVRAELLKLCTSSIDANSVKVRALLAKNNIALDESMERFFSRYYSEYALMRSGRVSAQSFVANVANAARDHVTEIWNRSVTNQKTGQWRRVAEPGCCEFCAELNGITFPAGMGDFEAHNNCRCYAVPV
jgi:hypothetical protein